jgi:putative tryptophan/tyrosine transport system substrate-binding protein
MKAKMLLFTLAVIILATIRPAEAQQTGKVHRIGYLAPRSHDPANKSFSALSSARTKAFREGLRALGYVEGQNIVIEYRSAEGKRDRLPKLAAELVPLNLDVIFAYSLPAVRALKKVTTTIPIVTVSGDPVRFGLVASLAHPGGNITGLANLTPELAGKRLELLKKVVLTISRVAVLWNPVSSSARLRMRETEAAANSMDIKLRRIAWTGPNDLERAFSAMKKERADALVPIRDIVINIHLPRIAALAAQNQLPTMYDDTTFVEAGGLMSYGTVIADLDRRAARYVDKILKGANPADLPIEQPTKFELVINLKTAKQLGLTIPPEVLYRADKIIK